MANIRLPETIGTSFNDTFTASAETASFGLQGNDTFTVTASGYEQDWIFFLGGQGDDTYYAADNAAISIGDTGGSGGDTIVADGISIYSSLFCTIDGGRHLLASDDASGQQVLIFNWKQAANRIETFQLADETYTYSQIVSLAASVGIPDNSWATVAASGMLSGHTPAEVQEAFTYYTTRVAYLESIAPLLREGGAGNDNLAGGLGGDTLTGGAGNDTLYGNAGDDTLTGDAGNDSLNGGAGNDSLAGGLGNDTYIVDSTGDLVDESGGDGGDGSDLVLSSAASFTLSAGVENLTLTGTAAIDGTGNGGANYLTGNSGVNTLTGGAGNDTLSGGANADHLLGGAGDDTYLVDNTGDIADETGGDGSDTVLASVTFAIGAGVENLTLTGTGNLNGTGNDAANLLTGNSGANRLEGGDGNDTLAGSLGTDTLSGGLGDDTYTVAATDGADKIVEAADAGIDTVRTALTAHTLAANVETLVYTGSAAFAGTGNSLDNLLSGGAGNDTLTGGAGNDTLRGGAGNDTYIVDTVLDVVDETSGGDGNDTVRTALTAYTLNANLENLTLTGPAFTGTGNAANNLIAGGNGNDTLAGAAGNDTLDGGLGNDSLAGGLGNDTYLVDSSDDTIVDTGGTDTVRTTLASFTLTDIRLENLAYAGLGAVAFTGTGNSLANLIAGGLGDDTLDGLGGSDTLAGGLGDDTYTVDNNGDKIVEAAGEGTDTVRTALTAYTLAANLENLLYTGTGTAALTLAGNSLANAISGGLGDDTLDGGLGDDTYTVDATGDKIVDSAGYDAVLASASYTLGDGVEKLVLTGTANLDGAGNALGNTLVGNAGSNWLQGLAGSDSLVGGAGNDTMQGGLGDDTYLVDRSDDTIVDTAGTDLVLASAGYTLGADVENLTLTGAAALRATGNALANVLTGNAGASTLAGGLGDDTYVVGNANIRLVEDAAAGTDTVLSSVNLTLGDNLENLTLTGSAVSAAGNALANVLSGGTGADAMYGGAGNDTYIVDDSGDRVYETAATGGTDLVRSSVDFDLGDYVENLTLTGSGGIAAGGNALANTLTGNSGDNTLDGGLGNDYMAGGLGDDTYVVDSAADRIIEAAGTGTGTDTVRTDLAAYTLGANLENLTLDGSGDIAATGNALANVLTGNSGDNTLDGGLGNDTMYGGAGDDTYIVADAGDVVSEGLNAGTDTVRTGRSYTLGDNVENLTLLGSGALSGTGNALANFLTGNAGGNALTGGAGDDTLDGGEGSDTMTGGLGDDTYLVDSALDQIIEGPGAGTDTVRSSFSYTLGDNLENLTLVPGAGSISAFGNALANHITGNSGNNSMFGDSGDDTLDGGLGVDTMTGGLGDDTYVIDRSADVVREDEFGGTDTVLALFSYTLGDYLENLTLGGTGDIAGTGNDLANVLTGNTGLSTLAGGLGDDTYILASASTRLVENLDAGTDTVSSSLSYTLDDNLENLVLTGAAGLAGTGNSLDNVITGTGGNDTLAGGGGTDTLLGGLGDDTYLVTDSLGVIVENPGAGTDTVLSAADAYTLGAGVENLFISGNAGSAATGNALANLLIGGGGDDTLDGGFNGGPAVDILQGGNGDDTYIVNSYADIVVESKTMGGTDTVRTALANYTLGDAVENLTLTGYSATTRYCTGNSLDNILTGGDGNDILTGGTGNNTGNDTLAGGAGADYYCFRGDFTGQFGQDVIAADSGNSADTVDMSGFSSTDTNIYLGGESGHDLIVDVGGASLTIVDWALSPGYQLNNFVFFDGPNSIVGMHWQY